MRRFSLAMAGVLVGVLSSAMPAAATGLRVEGLFASFPSPASQPIDLVRTDSAGRVYALSGHRIASFNADGTLLSEWSVPAESPGSPGVAMDVLPSGDVFAAEVGGTRVHRFGPAGQTLSTWNGGGALGRVRALAADPRQSLLIADDTFSGGPVGQKRFTLEGRLVRREPGVTQQTTIAASGRRWSVFAESVWGYLDSGRQFQILGDECTLGGGEREGCPVGIGTFAARPPEDLSASSSGGLLTVGFNGSGADRVQVFTRDGRVRFACDHLVTAGRVTTADWRDADHLVLGVGATIYRAAATRQPTCLTLPLRVRGVAVMKGRELRYRVLTRRRLLASPACRGVGSAHVARDAPPERT